VCWISLKTGERGLMPREGLSRKRGKQP
jgi:hypothetical protein